MRAFEGKRAREQQPLKKKNVQPLLVLLLFSARPYRVAFVLVLVSESLSLLFANFYRDWLALQKIIAVTFYNLLKKYTSWSKE